MTYVENCFLSRKHIGNQSLYLPIEQSSIVTKKGGIHISNVITSDGDTAKAQILFTKAVHYELKDVLSPSSITI